MTAPRPLVTVMIPTFNQAAYLPLAVRSALGQDYPNLEVVIADDASTDATPEVARAFSDDARVRSVRRETNLGRVANYRRTLYNDARGKYVLNLDGDDWLTCPDYLSRAVAILEANDAVSFVFGNQGRFLAPDGTLLLEHNRNKNLPTLLDGNWLFLNYPRGELAFPHLSSVYRRDDALRVGFYTHDIIGSDAESLRRLLPDRQVGFIDAVAGVWRAHAVNASGTRNVGKHLRDLEGVEATFRYAEATGVFSPEALRRWRRQMLALNCFEFFYLALKGRQPLGCLHFLAGLARSRRDALRALLLSADVPLTLLARKLGRGLRPAGS